MTFVCSDIYTNVIRSLLMYLLVKFLLVRFLIVSRSDVLHVCVSL